MSLAGITLITALRAALVAIAVVAISARCVRPLRARLGNSALWLLLFALLMPPMIVGYHVATTRAAAGGWAAELTYSALVFFRVGPLGMMLVWLWPPHTSSAGNFVFATMNRLSLPARRRLKIRESLAEFSSIFCIVFVVAFQEFELAACMNARSWTISLFDAQAGGLALGESLRLMLWPLAIECVAIAGMLTFHKHTETHPRREPARNPESSAFAPMTVLFAAVFLPIAGPLFVIAKGFTGLAILKNFALGREVANSFLLALAASAAGWLLAGWALKSRVRTAVFALPGLFGCLVVSLSLLALFQTPLLHLLRSSPLPVITALVLGLAPAALFIRHILAAGTNTEAVHAARMMGNSTLLWTLTKRPALWAGALLFLQAYGDFTANSLLAPPALTSAFSRIFNLMHYGQTPALSAMLLVTLAVPLIAVFVVATLARTHANRREN